MVKRGELKGLMGTGSRPVQSGREEGRSDREQGDGEARGGRGNAAPLPLALSATDTHTVRHTRTHTEARVGAHRRGRHQYLQPVK